jgi:glutamine---fructose-6-phosphate transaminase (isomerizing)
LDIINVILAIFIICLFNTLLYKYFRLCFHVFNTKKYILWYNKILITENYININVIIYIMCGISAIISKNSENIMPLLFESIKQLQNRGYDSVGFSYRDVIGDVFIHKKAMTENESCSDFLNSQHNKISSMAMAHTRWATHGSVTDSNSHPHISFDNRVSIVHNGIIENYKDLKRMLVNKLSIKFQTETDSEIIANVIAYRLSIDNNETEAIKSTIKLLQGTYGLCIMFNGTDNIYAVKNGSPLLIG